MTCRIVRKKFHPSSKGPVGYMVQIGGKDVKWFRMKRTAKSYVVHRAIQARMKA